MRRISMITFHTPKNYGAVLQAYSLMSYLKTLSEDVRIIDFNTPHLRSIYPLIPRYYGIKGKVKMLVEIPVLLGRKEKYRKFESFVKENLILTQRYESYGELMQDPPNCDIFITGSDQVFNPNRIEEERKAFYLEFVPEGKKRVSYAASFGCSNIPEEMSEEIAGYLNHFQRITVREQSGIGIVKDLTEKNAMQVLDPVFLNDKEFWKRIAEKPRDVSGRYMLYYRLMGNREKDKQVAMLAKSKGLDVVTITDRACFMSASKNMYNVGPKEFLGLFQDAEYVITDSFHGVAFSLIFEKQFLFIDTNPQLNERGLSLLRLAGAEEEAYIETAKKEKSIDYESVHKCLDPVIKQSRDYLQNVIAEV